MKLSDIRRGVFASGRRTGKTRRAVAIYNAQMLKRYVDAGMLTTEEAEEIFSKLDAAAFD